MRFIEKYNRRYSNVALLAAFTVLMATMSISHSNRPPINSLVGGQSLGCGLTKGAAIGLEVSGLAADGTIVGAPAGAVLGIAGLLVGAGYYAFCA